MDIKLFNLLLINNSFSSAVGLCENGLNLMVIFSVGILSNVLVAQSSSSSSQPTAGTSESHTSGGRPTERATWTLQEPTGSEHEVDYFAACLAN
jgi:hypothetical protein